MPEHEAELIVVNKLITTLRKNSTEEIRVGLDEYRGHNLVSIRVWTDPYAGTERVATKKGISIAVRLLPELIAALQWAEVEAREAGLLGNEGQPVAAE